MRKILFALLLGFTSLANAVISLESPEVLLKKAATDRQQLRDVVLAIELQMPEMRNVQIFESYFFILDELKTDSDRLGLDDLFPGAVTSLATKMAGFGIKWVDLKSIDPVKLTYYVKWMDIDAVANLLAYANYQSKKYLAVEELKGLASSVDLLIQLTQDLIKDRFDIIIGYRELSSSIAVKFLFNPLITPEERNFWANKIYTSQALGLYLDLQQKVIYNLNSENKDQIVGILESLNLSYQISGRLVDSPTSYIYDRTSDLALEVIKKSFELGYQLTHEQINTLILPLGPKHMQGLTYFITSASEAVIARNPENLIFLGQSTLQLLVKNSLVTEALNLNTFLEKISAAVIITRLQAEGTYLMTDKSGRKWKFSIVRVKPYEFIAALADADWIVTKSFYSIKYSAETNSFLAKESINEFENSGHRSVATFTISADRKISLSDLYGSENTRALTGYLIEPIPPMDFSQRLMTSGVRIYEGQIKFAASEKPRKVTLTIQSDGLSASGRLSDNDGLIYEFTSGFFNSDDSFNLTTGRLATTWVQIRGSAKNSEIKARVFLGGRGFITSEFILKAKPTSALK